MMRRDRDFERQMRLSVAQCLARGDYEIAEFQAHKYFPHEDLYEIIAPALRQPGRNPRPYPRRPQMEYDGSPRRKPTPALRRA